MTSPGSKQQQEDRLQSRLNKWATANLDPRKYPQGKIKVRGEGKLIKKFGLSTVLRIQQKAREHRLLVWMNLRKVHGLPTFKLLSKTEQKIVGVKQEEVLFIRTKLGISRVRDSRGILHWRSVKTGRFTKQPRRQRKR